MYSFLSPRRPRWLACLFWPADDRIKSHQNRLFEPTLPATATAAAASFLILQAGIYVRCTACVIFDLPPKPNRRFGDFLCNGFCSGLNYIFLLIADGVKYYQLRQPPPTNEKPPVTERKSESKKDRIGAKMAKWRKKEYLHEYRHENNEIILVTARSMASFRVL